MTTKQDPSASKGADRALDETGRNLRQAQERLARLLAAARLARSRAKTSSWRGARV